jgi:hypothetical protein
VHAAGEVAPRDVRDRGRHCCRQEENRGQMHALRLPFEGLAIR